ncbi:MAG: DUF72 domain-containing protein [Nitrospirota bacterium]
MIRVGTCSWTEKTLMQSGEFYPEKVKTPEERLRYYAHHFTTVEVDSTYYAIPDKRTTHLWNERTPEDFIFHIKAYGALTGHGVAPKTLPKDIFDLLSPADRTRKYVYIKEPALLESITARFSEALAPLRQSDKLGCVVFQYPPWFRHATAHMDVILRSTHFIQQDMQVAVEFRHGSWLTSDTTAPVLQFLKDHQLSYISADEPQYGSLATVPFIPDATTDIAYFRFHGRNTQNWLKKGTETALRYSYLYSDEELAGFVHALRTTEKKTKVTYAMFNNCHGGFAMRNAMRLQEMTKGRA